ncbi:inducible metalloproteinase inhibitor protein-like [Vespa mandarinia]|uniref:inducible metalloproteinase inhibitor protein-like n=1 Tax=Vespa mandarinia TaxID=7446 RepID=UPI001616E78C|nr:inducible metalloproteinase inhibitor protein-like [Vespa mandarinia]
MRSILSISFVILTMSLLTVVNVTCSDIVCDRPNEVYECGSACQTSCESLGEPCPIVNIRCNDACYCIDNYARNDEGNCIPISECPPKKN